MRESSRKTWRRENHRKLRKRKPHPVGVRGVPRVLRYAGGRTGRIAGGRAPHEMGESSRKTWRRENHRKPRKTKPHPEGVRGVPRTVRVETKDEGRSRGDAEIAEFFEQEVTEGTEGRARFLCCLCFLLLSLFSVVPLQSLEQEVTEGTEGRSSIPLLSLFASVESLLPSFPARESSRRRSQRIGLNQNLEFSPRPPRLRVSRLHARYGGTTNEP
jgi:hypothetical protein